MKKVIYAFAIAILSIFAAPAMAWDGTVTGTVTQVDVTDGGVQGFRVYLVGMPTMCTGGLTWAYLNDTDSNFKSYVATLLTAKISGTTVTIYTTKVGSYCHIGFMSSV